MQGNHVIHPDAHLARSPAEPLRVLIVDDDSDLRRSVKTLLKGAGYDVEAAPNGERALQAQRQRPAQVLISDIFMPDMDGIETIREFRRLHPEMRIVAISGNVNPRLNVDYLSVAEAAGADAVLRKPFTAEALLEAVRVEA